MKAFRLVLAAALLAGLAPVLAAQVTAGDPIVGNRQAKVHLIMYQDLECPKCALFHQALTSNIMPAYGNRVEFEFRDYPMPYHPWAFNAAVIARYLDTRDPQLGMAWRDYCFQHQTTIYAGTLLDQAAAFCLPHGVTRAALASVFSRADLFAEVQRDQQAGKDAKLTGTPFVIINGAPLPDSATVPDLVADINAALARAGAAH